MNIKAWLRCFEEESRLKINFTKTVIGIEVEELEILNWPLS